MLDREHRFLESGKKQNTNPKHGCKGYFPEQENEYMSTILKTNLKTRQDNYLAVTIKMKTSEVKQAIETDYVNFLNCKMSSYEIVTENK